MTNRDTACSFWSNEAASGDGQSYFSSPAVSSLREQVAPPVTVSHGLVKGVRNQLKFFDRLAVDKASREETRRVAGELIVQLLAAQKEKIMYQITLDLDAEKKHLFVEAMREGSRIEQEIAERSTIFERQLMDLALDQGLAGHEHKKMRCDKLDQLRVSGRIDDQSYEIQRTNIENWARIFGNNLNAKVELMLRNHAQAIERTLRLFQERAIPGHAR